MDENYERLLAGLQIQETKLAESVEHPKVKERVVDRSFEYINKEKKKKKWQKTLWKREIPFSFTLAPDSRKTSASRESPAKR